MIIYNQKHLIREGDFPYPRSSKLENHWHHYIFVLTFNRYWYVAAGLANVDFHLKCEVSSFKCSRGKVLEITWITVALVHHWSWQSSCSSEGRNLYRCCLIMASFFLASSSSLSFRSISSWAAMIYNTTQSISLLCTYRFEIITLPISERFSSICSWFAYSRHW